MTPVKQTLRELLNSAYLYRPEHADLRRLLRRQRDPLRPAAPTARNLQLAIEWIAKAQDATGGGGVSWGYLARTNFGSTAPVGWRSAYPETTGYIIETAGQYAKRTQSAEMLERVRRMADWEASIQLPDGGIQGGRVDATPVESSTFVTGQVLFGFVWAYEEFGNPVYLEAGRRAGDFLLSCLDQEGRFVRGYSHFCAPGPKAYEARTGWALAELGRVSGEGKYTEAARSMARFALSQRRENGWFAMNDLEDHTRPLTHTIGYVLEGVWETARLTGDAAFQEPVLDSLQRIRPLVREDGFLAGRWLENWKPAVPTCCLTGSSQIALVALRAYARTGDRQLHEMARRLLAMVSATQLEDGYHPGLIGGIHGSYPFGGEYGPNCVLNWATKFYADAVMAYLDAAPRTS